MNIHFCVSFVPFKKVYAFNGMFLKKRVEIIFWLKFFFAPRRNPILELWAIKLSSYSIESVVIGCDETKAIDFELLSIENIFNKLIMRFNSEFGSIDKEKKFDWNVSNAHLARFCVRSLFLTWIECFEIPGTFLWNSLVRVSAHSFCKSKFESSIHIKVKLCM